MNQEQIDALLAQKLARARHALAQDALLQHERVWDGVKKLTDLDRAALHLAAHKEALDMVRIGAANDPHNPRS